MEVNTVTTVGLTEWKHIPCFVHNLSLVVQYGLQSIKGLHTKANSVVNFFKSIPQASSTLKAMQKQLGKPALSPK
jgi:hypothetical protein